MRTHLTLLFAFMAGIVSGQISFTESQTSATTGFRSGFAVVCTDMNGDTYDDLVRLDQGVDLQVDLLRANNNFYTSYQNTVANSALWNLVAGDINNDGLPDIATSGAAFDGVKVLRSISNSYDFEVLTLSDSAYFAQAANLADANGDGYPDLFVCNDDGLNRLYINDGTGNCERNDTIIDFNTIPPSDNSGSYGSVWTDFDLDNDLDLYVAKCSGSAPSPSDPRRINVLYVKTDTGYVEMADTFGLASGEQSWCSDFADIDNDGDFDLLVINHITDSELFENAGGGNYTEIGGAAGLSIPSVIIESIFADFDNDGFVDLLVAGNHSRLFRNQGDKTFEQVTSPFDGEDITSFTIGDFNNDGFPDVYAIYNSLYNNPSNTDDDKIWLNDGNDNNYLRIKAIGTNNNPDAIGTKLFLHAGGVDQIREVRAGESYGISTTLIKIFGLGSAAIVDSLSVVWPNGDEDTYYNISVNQTVTVTQGGCLRPVVALNQGPFIQCGTDTFTITAPGGYGSYLWSNGDTSQSVQVTMPGLYHVSLTDTAGCITVTTPVTVMPCMWPSDVVYVDSSATGNNTGYDWPNAFTDFQQALTFADSFSVDAMWVAGGTYFPTSGLDRTASFVLVDSVKIYGGFDGSETQLASRDVLLHPTRLSGDIGFASDSTDNSYHVIVCPDSVSDVRLDGFIIQDGLANGVSMSQSHGAAIFCEGKMSVYNSILRACSGDDSGVYVFNTGSSAELILNNCQIAQSVPDGVSNVNNAKIIIEGLNEVGY